MKKLFISISIIIVTAAAIVSCKSLDHKQMACDQAGDEAYNSCMGDSKDDAKIVACEAAKQKAIDECMKK